MVELLQDHCGPSGHRCPIVVVQTLPAESEHRQVAAVEKQIDPAHAPIAQPGLRSVAIAARRGTQAPASAR